MKETLAGSLSAEMGGTSGVLHRWKAQARGSPGRGLDQSACRADPVTGGGSVISDLRCPTGVDGCPSSTVPPETPSVDPESPTPLPTSAPPGWTAWFGMGGRHLGITGRHHRNTQLSPDSSTAVLDKHSDG